jgi:hypothetical protein
VCSTKLELIKGRLLFTVFKLLFNSKVKDLCSNMIYFFPKNNASSQFFVSDHQNKDNMVLVGDVSIGIFLVVSNVLLIISTTMEVQFLSINL